MRFSPTVPSAILHAGCRIIGLLLLATLLQACSAVKLSYNNAPELLGWWLGGYIDLDEDQSVRLRSEMLQFQQWHRHSELPRYADSLQRLAQMAPNPMAAEVVCAVVADVQGNLDRLLAQAEPGLAALAMSLQPEQLQQVARKYAKTNAEYRSKWLESPPAERAKRRFVQEQERLEQLYGDLTEAQQTLLRQQLDTSLFDPRTAYAERLRRQQDLLDTLRRTVADALPAPAAREALHGVADRALHTGNPTYRQYAEALLREGCGHFAAMHNTTSPAQREVAVKRLKSYERDFRELAAKP